MIRPIPRGTARRRRRSARPGDEFDALADDLRLLVAVGLIRPLGGHGAATRYGLTEQGRRAAAEGTREFR